MKIFNLEIMGLENSIIASGYPMKSTEILKFEDYDKEEIYKKGIERAKKLGNVEMGTGHDSFAKGIKVQFDITYANFWTPQAQRYNFFEIISSTSKMHRITKMNLNNCCNKYVLTTVKFILKEMINVYNEAIENKAKKIFLYHPHGGDMICSYSFDEKKETTSFDVEELTIYQLYMKIISNCPMGLEQTMRVSASYLQLKTMYNQRKHHKLKEEWGTFCAFCESLPLFVDLMLKGQRIFTDDLGNPLEEIYNWKK